MSAVERVLDEIDAWERTKNLHVPILNQKLHFSSVNEINYALKKVGCRRCNLGLQPHINGCCVSRGVKSKNVIIGEAPGKEEDNRREPFTGPAGRLLDKIWLAAGMNTKDWYLTNVVKCRPVAPKHLGKQNITPKAEQIKQCSIFLKRELFLLQPRIVVTLGVTATSAILGRRVRMGDVRGKLTQASYKADPGVLTPNYVFPMIHPAAILHAQKNPDLHRQYRVQTWEDVQNLKRIVDELWM